MATLIICLFICAFASKLIFLTPVTAECAGPDPNFWTTREEEADGVLVRVQQGLLRGRKMDSAAGGSFLSFQGIPYAQPPVGELRFKDAEPPLAWSGVRSASARGNMCPQPLPNRWGVLGDEDCLVLNVYTPAPLPARTRTRAGRPARLPVMLWVHGGGFTTGSGNNDIYGPDYLLSENVIVVTINYRLGALGFLYLDEAAPGNVGMKDQVAALRWVHENMLVFGGDPAKVTIFGQSAGAASVQLLMLSPLTRGLFQAAIIQSGHVINKWANSAKRREISLSLANVLQCNAGNDTAIVNCLRLHNASAIIAATSRLISRVVRNRIRNRH